MCTRMRVIGLLIFAGALASGVGAQTQSAAERSMNGIGGWPASVDARTVAWMAHDAVASGDKSKMRELLALADQWTAAPERTRGGDDDGEASGANLEVDETLKATQAEQRKDQKDALAEVLDALIAMKAEVPSETLRKLAPEFGNYVAVLLSRIPDGRREALGFEIYREDKNGRGLQYMSAAMLAQHPVPGFAENLLAHVTVRAEVYVVLPGELVGGGSSHCGAVFVHPKRSDGWPKIGQYELSDEWQDGALSLVEGNNPVYARRFESDYYLWDVGTIYLGADERVKFIAEMLGISAEEIPWNTSITSTIEFESNAQTEQALREFVEHQREMQRETANALKLRGLLTAREAETTLPELLLTVKDMREGSSESGVDWQAPTGVKLVSQNF